MTLPFLHPSAAALYVGKRRLTWVSAVRWRHRLHALALTHEPLGDGGAAAALARLVARVRPPHPYVVTHLDALHLRHAVLHGPGFDDAAAFGAWLQAEAARLLPPRAAPGDFVSRCLILDEEDEQARCLLVLASRNAVAQRVAMLGGAGLKPLCLTSTSAALSQLLGLAAHRTEARTALLHLRTHDALLMHAEEGRLAAMTLLPCSPAETEAALLLGEVAAVLPGGVGSLSIVGEGAGRLAEAARTAGGLGVPVRPFGAAALPRVRGLPADEAPAAALALYALFADAAALSFLDEETIYEGVQAIEKREALRASLALGSIVGLLLLALTAVHAGLATRQAASSAVLKTLAAEVEARAATRADVARLERELRHAERLVAERTDVARLLEAVGRAVPEALWLDAAALEETPGAVQLTLRGAALSERALAVYLHRLERAAFGATVRLLYSEAVPAVSAYPGAAHADRLLTRFEIRLDLPTKTAR
ncbi:MAG: PilN domain-containing protein [Rhodothermales bacterium]|nr:PilN domain-containing protein [Rhodothermales bacterium]